MLNAITDVLTTTHLRRQTGRTIRRAPQPPLVGSTIDLRLVDTLCGPLDEDVWDRVVALRRETADEQTGESWREWARALRAAVDAGQVRLLLVMDGPRLRWFAAVATDTAVAIPQSHVRARTGSTGCLPC